MLVGMAEETASWVAAGEPEAPAVAGADLEGRGVGVAGSVGALEALGKGEAQLLGVAVKVREGGAEKVTVAVTLLQPLPLSVRAAGAVTLAVLLGTGGVRDSLSEILALGEALAEGVPEALLAAVRLSTAVVPAEALGRGDEECAGERLGELEARAERVGVGDAKGEREARGVPQGSEEALAEDSSIVPVGNRLVLGKGDALREALRLVDEVGSGDREALNEGSDEELPGRC